MLTAPALSLPSARASILNAGPHGLSEVLYAFTSGTNNNGSAFGGLNANTNFYNTALALAMLIGRFGSIVLVMGLAGRWRKKHVPESLGHVPDHVGALRRAAGRRDRHRHGAHVLPRPVAGAARRGADHDRPPARWAASPDAIRKLDPRTALANPVMFVVDIGSRAHDRPVHP